MMTTSVVGMGVVLVLMVAGAATAKGPPRHMPEELKDRYTMDGTVPIASFFVDDTNEGQGTHYQYPRSDMELYVKAAREEKKRYASWRGGPPRNKGDWIHEALRRFPIQGKVGVYGSIEPRYEAIALAYGANEVVTIEYNKLTYDYPGLTTATVVECKENYALCGDLDFAMSISSFDHDGLGRYGDPLDPDGDLKAMATVMHALKPGGILFLTVPVGPDVVVWNLHRRYGTHRLPRLLEGWKVLDRVYWDDAKVTAQANWRQTYEPVFVLQKPREGDEL